MGRKLSTAILTTQLRVLSSHIQLPARFYHFSEKERSL